MGGGFFDKLTASDADDVASPRASIDSADRGAEPVSEASRVVRDAALELLKHGVIEEARKPNIYRILRTNADAVGRILQPLDLRLCMDEIRGIVFVAVAASAAEATDDEWSHPLVRKQRLTLEQSLLVAILRQQFVAYELDAGVGAGDARVAIDDLLPHLQVFLGDLGSDSQEKRRLMTVLEGLKGYGLVSDIDEHERVTIRPLIAHLANPENLQNLIQALRVASDPKGLRPTSMRDGET